MPVSNISVFVFCSVNLGACRWIGYVFSDFGVGWPSTASPRTLKILPSETFPTGTEIGAPVFKTSVPRLNPSVVVMAIVLTILPANCCWTSKTKRVVLPFSCLISVSSAVKILGIFPSNLTSTTGPITCEIIPLFPPSAGVFLFIAFLSSFFLSALWRIFTLF